MKILAYGDPYIETGSKAETDYRNAKKSAETDFKLKNDHMKAYESYGTCLKFFDLDLPKNKLEKILSTFWQLIRMTLHQLYIGKWISRKANASKSRSDALNSAKELAFVYHRLNQINLTSNIQDNNGLMLSFYAVNMAEAANSIMKPQHMAEIYLTAALRVKKTYPRFLQFFCR